MDTVLWSFKILLESLGKFASAKSIQIHESIRIWLWASEPHKAATTSDGIDDDGRNPVDSPGATRRGSSKHANLSTHHGFPRRERRNSALGQLWNSAHTISSVPFWHDGCVGHIFRPHPILEIFAVHPHFTNCWKATMRPAIATNCGHSWRSSVEKLKLIP